MLPNFYYPPCVLLLSSIYYWSIVEKIGGNNAMTYDAARRPALPLAGAQVILAAAEGTLAAVVVDQELLFT